jgi:hypothetical protein
MKRLISILIIIFIAVFSYGQKLIPDSQLAGVDTLKGADTVYINTPMLKWNLEYIGLQVLCEELGGTSDGTIYPRTSIDDTSYANVTTVDYVVNSFPNDTLTISDGAVGLWNMTGLSNNYYGIMAIGTVGDTTKLTVKYSIKGRR